MATVDCECGVTYSPQDIYAKNRHEASTKHRANLPTVASRHEKDNVTDETTPDPYTETFDDLDLDEEPVVEKPKAKRAPRKTPTEKIAEGKAKVAKQKANVTKVVNVGNHKACRVCGEDKPLEEYRRKSSRPDGRDTICAVCSKAWLVDHLAKKAASK